MEFYTSCKKLGNNILYRGVNEYDKRITDKFEYGPTLYVEDYKTNCNHKSLFEIPLKPIPFSSINEANDFIKQYSNVENFSIYGEKRFEYCYLADIFKEISYDISKILIYSIDIETELETKTGFPDPRYCREEISLITIHNSITNKMIGFGKNTLRKKIPDDWEYHECVTEKQLLKRFLSFWTSDYPNVVTHWNGRLFDIPYIFRRISMVLGEQYAKKLSPFGYVSEREETIGNKDYFIYDIYGIESIDYLDAYKKFTYVTQESYKLDHIAKVELGEQKVENPYDTFREFYVNDWDKFVEYCFIDTELVVKLEKKLKLIELIITIAYLARCNYSDVMSPVKTWEIIIYNKLLSRNVITPLESSGKKMVEYPGAYVKEPVLGMQKWVVSFDVNSEYPHIDIQYNISPETLVEDKKLSVTVDGILNREYDFSEIPYAIAANGILYRKDKKGILPELMEFYYNERVKTRKLMKDPSYKDQLSSLDNAQMAYKILINSLYGAAANQHFKFFDVRLAESITLSGQVAIRWVGNHINKYLNKVCRTENEHYLVYTDTDSTMFRFDKLVEIYLPNVTDEYEIAKFIDKISREMILPEIEKAFVSLAEYTNCTENKLKMARENIASSAFWTAKKKYAMAVLDQDGKVYNPPKLKIMGLEIVRSSTPQFVRDSLKKTVELILREDINVVREYVDEFRDIFFETPVELIAFPRGINNIEKYYDIVTTVKSGCPIQVRSAILYNNFVKKNKLDDKYPLIQDGDKIKFVYLKMPNTLKQNVIGWMGKIPSEMSLDKYIDYDTMYSKVFIEPLTSMLDSLDWHLKEKIDIRSFFN